MFSGLTLASVLGVPAGTALGQAFGWRSAFWAIVPIGFIAATALFFFVPQQSAGATNIVHEFRVLRRPIIRWAASRDDPARGHSVGPAACHTS